MKREFENIKEFQYLLNKETWQEMFLECEENVEFNAFMYAFLCYFDIAFLLKLVNVRELPRNSWITKGIKICSKEM
jgi:hypothetical protein